MIGMKKAVLALSAVGLMVILLNMFANRPAAFSNARYTRDESQLTVPGSSEGQFGAKKKSGYDADVQRKMDAKLWGMPGLVLEPCWSELLPKRSAKTWGFVVVTAANGPHNHRQQIADAVVVASQLGASLILPNIKEALKEPNSRFEDLYNVRHFISSLDGVVRVVGRFPGNETERTNRTITRIPLKVTPEYIAEKVRPIFKQQSGVVYLGAFLPAVKGGPKEDKGVAALRCLVMHKALQYNNLVQRQGDHLVSRMIEAAEEASSKRFVAIDLQVDLLRHKTCNVTDVNKRRCLEPQEVGRFLQRVGYPSETAIYLTQSRWDPSLDSLRQMFPNLHTKEYSMPFNEENQYLLSGTTQFEQAVDFYVCSRSDVFIATVPGVFYVQVTGERISAGLNHIILPTLESIPGSTEFQFIGAISPYVQKKNHPAYHCFCEPSLDASVNKSQGVVAALPVKSKQVPVVDQKGTEKKKSPKVVSL